MKLKLHQEEEGLIASATVRNSAPGTHRIHLALRGPQELTLFDAGGALGFEDHRRGTAGLGLRTRPGQPAILSLNRLLLLPLNTANLQLDKVQLSWSPELVEGRPIAAAVERLRDAGELPDEDERIYTGQHPFPATIDMIGVEPPHSQLPYRGMKLAALWLHLAQYIPTGPHLRGVAEARAELVIELEPGETTPQWPAAASIRAAMQKDPSRVKPIDLRPALGGGA